MTEETGGCVGKVLFYEQLELLKASKKGKIKQFDSVYKR